MATEEYSWTATESKHGLPKPRAVELAGNFYRHDAMVIAHKIRLRWVKAQPISETPTDGEIADIIMASLFGRPL